jgi:hypothetical protein
MKNIRFPSTLKSRKKREPKTPGFNFGNRNFTVDYSKKPVMNMIKILINTPGMQTYVNDIKKDLGL